MPEEVEAMVFYLGLLLVKDFLDTLVLLEGDNATIVKLLNDKRSLPPWQINNIISDDILCQNPNVTISYVPRDCNKAAHSMAAIASKEHVSLKWNGTNLLQRNSSILEMD